jgi:DNA-binding IclR family transcriptional regulator
LARDDRDVRPVAAPASQTLDRGLTVLRTVADSDEPLAIADVASAVGLHRSITYRMLRTLEQHGLVTRDEENRYRPGVGLAVLARRVAPHLRTAALPCLSTLADETRKTAFLVVPEGNDAVTIVVVEPRLSVFHVTYRPGARHELTRGAPGIAILAGRPAHESDSPRVEEVRRRGWAWSHSEVIPGFSACAAPVHDSTGECVGAVSVVYGGEADLDELGPRVVSAAQELGSSL